MCPKYEEDFTLNNEPMKEIRFHSSTLLFFLDELVPKLQRVLVVSRQFGSYRHDLELKHLRCVL